METFKYNIKDVFVLPYGNDSSDPNVSGRDSFNIVIYVTSNTLFTLRNYITSNGDIVGNWEIREFDLTQKSVLQTLILQDNRPIPTNKFGELGSKVLYVDDEYIYGGITLKSIGTMTFKKPLLINVDKIVNDISTEIELGNTDLQATLNIIWGQSTKVPLESDKNLSLLVLEEPKRPVKKFGKIEIPVSEESTESSGLIPPYRNATERTDFYPSELGALPPEALLTGFGMNVFINASFNNKMLFSFVGKYSEQSINSERISFSVDGFSMESVRIDYVLSEGERLFPDWKLNTDSTYTMGSGVSQKDKFYNVLGKVLMLNRISDEFTRFGTYQFYVGGSLNVKKYEDNFMLWHPQIYQGNNKQFKESSNDLFLLIGQPLIGTKSKGIRAVYRGKNIGSSQFPLKTRAQLKNLSIVGFNQIKQSNANAYRELKRLSAIVSTTFFTKEHVEVINDFLEREGISSTNIFGDINYGYDTPKFISFLIYRMLSQNNNLSNPENIEELTKYFDYENLAKLEQSNPKLYEKIQELISKSINTYFKSITTKKGSQSKSFNIIELLKIVMYEINIRINDDYQILKSSFRIRSVNNNIVYPPAFYDGTPSQKEYIENIVAFLQSIQNVTYQNEVSSTHDGTFLIKLEDLDMYMSKGKELYKYPIQKFLERNNNSVKVDIGSSMTSFISNYYAQLDFGTYPQLLPRLLVNCEKSWRGGFKNELVIGNNFRLTINIENLNEVDENIKGLLINVYNAYEQCHASILRLDIFKNLLELFKYYEMVSKYVPEISINDVHNDYRFKYVLLNARVVGMFSESDVDNVVTFVNELNSLMQAWYDEYSTTDTIRTEIYLELVNYLELDVNQVLSWEKILEDNAGTYLGSFTDNNSSFATKLIDPSIIASNLKNVMSLMRENEVVKKLMDGEINATDEWLKMFGYSDVSMPSVIEDQDEEEAEVIVEEVDEEEIIDFDFDSLDIDDIAIELSDDDILETNIEI